MGGLAREACVNIGRRGEDGISGRAECDTGSWVADRTGDAGFLQDYLERRIPFGYHRLLTQFGYIMSRAFETGARSGNRKLQGFAVKGMM